MTSDRRRTIERQHTRSRSRGTSESRSWRFPQNLLIAWSIIWLLLAVNPVSRQDWLLENLLVSIAVPTLVMTRHRLRFSNAAYACLFAFLALHAVGAHYTYSLVPYDRWWEAMTGTTFNGMIGWERNHYDRAVHLLYGALALPATVELFDRYAPPRAGWQWAMPVLFVMSHSVLYEMIEWIAALMVAPDLGNAYLGTQGDGWDAQKDMALATAGSIIAMIAVQVGRLQETGRRAQYRSPMRSPQAHAGNAGSH